MGKSLLKIPVFSSAIDRCAKVLQTKGLDLVNIITSDDPKALEDTISKVVSVVAIQVSWLFSN